MTKAIAESEVRNLRGAPRFQIAAPVRYRPCAGDWLEATTIDIGRLGLLMRTPYAAQPVSTVLQLRVALTTDDVRPGGHITCCGRVVRVAPGTTAGEVVMAVTIEEFQLQPDSVDSVADAATRAGDADPGRGSS